MFAADATENTPAQPPAKRIGPLRLVIRLILLAIIPAVLIYDFLIAKPAMVAAAKRLEVVVDKRLREGVEGGGRAKSADVQKAIGFPPTVTERRGDNVIEWYCWWGKVPLFSQRRRFLWVKYEGKEPQYVSTFDYDTSPDMTLADPSAPSEPVPGKMGHGDSAPRPEPAERDNAEPAAAPADETPAAPVGGTND
jgi:hypothetical protein